MFRGRALAFLLIALIALAAVWVLYFAALTGVGMLGPDEPRYAAIGREMARSGDWVTPRLWGRPWFEKPPLLYWLTAAAFKAGFSDDLAPRLPIAVLSVAFLGGYFLLLRREFGGRTAGFATAILGTSAGWVAYSRVAVTDLPLAATFGLAAVLALGWIERGDARRLAPAAVALGLAVLAKGLVPLLLALPVVWIGRKRWRDLIRPLPAVLFLAVAAPWYVLVTVRNGWEFINQFFIEHHLGRFSSEALGHQQPVWFYVPVLLALLFPWTPIAVLAGGRAGFRDPRRRALLAVMLAGLVFFSASRNKLPGYLLPLMPAAAALIGLAIAEARNARWALAASGLLAGAIPAIAQALPRALERGTTHALPPAMVWVAGLFPALAVAAWAWKARREAAIAAIVVAMTAGGWWIERTAFPLLDRAVSARVFWRKNGPETRQACVETAARGWRYSLNYYAETELPGCESAPRPLRIEQDAERGARLIGPVRDP